MPTLYKPGMAHLVPFLETRRGGTTPHQCKLSVRPQPLSQTDKPVSYRGTTTSSTGSRRPSQLSQDLRRTIFFFCQLVPFLLFPTTPWSSDNDPPSSTSSTVWPFRHTRCSWGCHQAGKRLSCALSNTTSDASGLRRQSLFAGAQVGEITCGGERTSFWFWSGCGLRCRRATCTPTRTSRALRLSLVCVPDLSSSVGQPLACPASRNGRPFISLAATVLTVRFCRGNLQLPSPAHLGIYERQPDTKRIPTMARLRAADAPAAVAMDRKRT